jgi:hypothetical protein
MGNPTKINPEKVACFSSPKNDRQLTSFHQRSTTNSPSKTTFCTPFLPKPLQKHQLSSLEKNYCKSGPLLRGGEAQRVVVFVEFQAEGFDDEVVVFSLGQAGLRRIIDMQIRSVGIDLGKTTFHLVALSAPLQITTIKTLRNPVH